MSLKYSIIGISLGSIIVGATVAPPIQSSKSRIVGAWRSQVQFKSGPFAAAKDLEFFMSINDGGTMTESSNYDGMPPVPPAYGAWKKIGANTYKLRYEYFNSKPPKNIDEIVNGGGWSPGGRGVIVEIVKLSQDGSSFTSELTFVLRDEIGKEIPGGGNASAKGVRISP